MNKHILKSIGAIFAGLVVGAILSLATDVVLHADGVYPPWGQVVPNPILLLATAYRTVYGVVGAYVAARLAPDRSMMHALVLGALGFVVSLLGAVVTWNKGPAYGPHWYPVALVVLALPTAWLGGWFRVRQLGGN